MTDEFSDGMECEQCGVCCKIFGDSILPSVDNVYHWKENGRIDILKHFYACGKDGSWIRCSDLPAEELGNAITIELRDPDTGAYESGCPFLRRISRERYICAIHLSKPDMCDNYRPWIWGESYFRRCRAIIRNEDSSFWNRE
jgi:Fe-S-cluster containining protein